MLVSWRYFDVRLYFELKRNDSPHEYVVFYCEQANSLLRRIILLYIDKILITAMPRMSWKSNLPFRISYTLILLKLRCVFPG